MGGLRRSIDVMMDNSGRIQCPFCPWQIGTELFFDHQQEEHGIGTPAEFVRRARERTKQTGARGIRYRLARALGPSEGFDKR